MARRRTGTGAIGFGWALLPAALLAAAALAAPVQWSGSLGSATVQLFVDGQRAAGGVRSDPGGGMVDLTLVGTGTGSRYAGALSGSRRPAGDPREQAIAGRWEADLAAPARVVIDITRVDGRPQQRRFTLPLSTSAAPPVLRCGWAKGSVTAQRGRAGVRPLRGGDAIAAGDTIRTDARSAAILVLGDRSVVMLQELTTLALPEGGGNQGAELQRLKASSGKIWFAVRKVGAGQRFEVETDEAVASVRGTEFLLEVGAGGEFELTTAEGQVEILDPAGAQAPVPVAAGMRFALAARRPGAPRSWRAARPVDLAPLVRRWEPMLTLADHLWVPRRAGKRGFWQDRFRPGNGASGPVLPGAGGGPDPGRGIRPRRGPQPGPPVGGPRGENSSSAGAGPAPSPGPSNRAPGAALGQPARRRQPVRLPAGPRRGMTRGEPTA
jgi:hypothetical protein